MGKQPIPQFAFPLPNPPVDLRFLGKLIPPPGLQYKPVRIAPYGASQTKKDAPNQSSSGTNAQQQESQKTLGKRPREDAQNSSLPAQKKFAPQINLGNIPVNTQLVQNAKQQFKVTLQNLQTNDIGTCIP
jgi:type IV secretory pathway VirB10-like protein